MAAGHWFGQGRRRAWRLGSHNASGLGKPLRVAEQRRRNNVMSMPLLASIAVSRPDRFRGQRGGVGMLSRLLTLNDTRLQTPHSTPFRPQPHLAAHLAAFRRNPISRRTSPEGHVGRANSRLDLTKRDVCQGGQRFARLPLPLRREARPVNRWRHRQSV